MFIYQPALLYNERMFRRCCFRFIPSFSLQSITDRLDSFEKEVIKLKAFRRAVEVTSPEVAKAAEELMKEEPLNFLSKVNLEMPLTPEEFIEMTQFYAMQKPHLIPVEHLLYVTTKEDLLAAGKKLHREALVRLSAIAKTLSLAPYGLSQMPGVQELIRWYQVSFHDFMACQSPKDVKDLDLMDTLARSVFLRHYNVSRLLCEGLCSLAEREGWDTADDELAQRFPELQDFFESFYSQRVKIRYLIGNYLHLSTQLLKRPKTSYEAVDKTGMTELSFFGHDPSTFVGQLCINTSLSILTNYCISVIQEKYADAKIELKIVGDESLTFIGIPYILCDIVAALVCDAVEENLHSQEILGRTPTSIEVTLVQKKNCKNYVLRVSDTAGGMRLQDARLAMTCWSTFRNCRHYDSPFSARETWIHSPIRLSYANCAANCFGGNVTVASIEGYGTDRQLYVPATGVAGVMI